MSEIDFKPCETALASQRAALLVHLQTHGTISTVTCRDQYGVMSPAARIMELRRAGHLIRTTRCVDFDEAGRRHPCARYELLVGGAR